LEETVKATFIAAGLIASLLLFPRHRLAEGAQHDDTIAWGGATNGLRAGLSLSEPTVRVALKTGVALTRVVPVISNVGTKRIRFFWPPDGQREKVFLVSPSGDLVPSSTPAPAPNGALVGPKTPVREWKRAGYMPHALEPGEIYTYDFVVDSGDRWQKTLRAYHLSQPGTYTLVKEVFVALPGAGGILKTIALPRITLPIVVE
jgi:hypothetical protein